MSVTLEAPQVIEDYLVMPDAEIAERIEAAREMLGPRVVILGHHYQRDDVIKHADLTGDSYQLSVMASQTEAEYIVFCGVHFMAESADIVGKDFQHVILPDLGAGCSMADMASIDQVEDAWEQLREIGVLKNKVAPITYMNSTAQIKAFCQFHVDAQGANLLDQDFERLRHAGLNGVLALDDALVHLGAAVHIV